MLAAPICEKFLKYSQTSNSAGKSSQPLSELQPSRETFGVLCKPSKGFVWSSGLIFNVWAIFVNRFKGLLWSSERFGKRPIISENLGNKTSASFDRLRNTMVVQYTNRADSSEELNEWTYRKSILRQRFLVIPEIRKIRHSWVENVKPEVEIILNLPREMVENDVKLIPNDDSSRLMSTESHTESRFARCMERELETMKIFHNLLREWDEKRSFDLSQLFT